MVRERYAAIAEGAGVIGSSPEELRTYLAAELDKWGVIIKEAGIKVE